MQPILPEPVFLNLDYIFFKLSEIFGGLIEFIFSIRFIHFLKFFGTIIIIVLIASIIYSLMRLYEIHDEEKKGNSFAMNVGVAAEGDPLTPTTLEKRNPVWENIRAKLLSDTPSDWRLAIIEADIYLDRVLDDQGFHGDTMSDKLKQVTPHRLGSIQMAWEAHKVRNRIAHEGVAFNLSMPEARRVLSYYEIVFRDLEVIA